ncbi:MAG: dienelactone hydrolase family protein, partial [Myxococcales bacterium]|nr:dienelactone hydrolase family protein [Myxococcales bacterium]
ETREYTCDGKTKTVYRAGHGPAIVVMHEIPGLTPAVIKFATHLVDQGFSVYCPDLFGTPGKGYGPLNTGRQIARACISREFHVLARRHSSPITIWLRALCRAVSEESGGAGIGAVGMCLTGNFALALMVDECVMAPVLAQPSLPFPISPSHKRALHLSDQDLAAVKRRTADGAKVLGLRFTRDPLCPPQRFAHLREELGEGFEAIEIPSGRDANDGTSFRAHSVTAFDFVDEEGHPTLAARQRIVGFFREHLTDAPK